MRVTYRMLPFKAKELWLCTSVSLDCESLMVHAIRLLTANGFAQKANLTTDNTDLQTQSSPI
jgi:hypothetical protein